MTLLFGVFLLILSINSSWSAKCPQPDGILSPDPSEVHYYLYEQAGSAYTEIFPGQLAGVTYNANAKVVFLTHGFNHTGFITWIQDMKDKMFGVYTNPNVIIIDWSAISSFTNYYDAPNLIYPATAYRTCQTGVFVGEFMAEISEVWGIPSSEMEFVGHSLGAHLGGSAGQAVQDSNGQKIGRIVGLDPAGPMFTGGIPDCRLSSDDATNVNTIRTNAGGYGYEGNIAADYYPNGGINQPGCPNTSSEYTNPTVCSHCFSYRLYSASLISNGTGFDSRTCSDYISYEAGSCKSSVLSQMGFFSILTTPSKNILDTTGSVPYFMSGALHSQTLTGTLG